MTSPANAPGGMPPPVLPPRPHSRRGPALTVSVAYPVGALHHACPILALGRRRYPQLHRCGTIGCGLRFLASGHRHCCSTCRRTGGIGHSHRCGHMQHELWTQVLRFDPSMLTTHQCMTSGCGRSASGGHRTCCSRYGLSGGQVHSARCHRMMHAGGTQQPTASASSTSTVAAGSGSLAPAHPPATTASVPAGSELSSTATTDPGTQSVLSQGTTDGSLEDAHAWNGSAVAHSGQNHYEPLELDELD